ncbi:cell division protein ZapA [Tellurirhabdus bombi]|uniref:cell division protein ZapA n=1 Tax=Tellurirhabdus bombi TaxID=2907205 RepID=UPI001F3846B0|nr:cell division protein ZapA [Tellurirhabdus bombi]
MEDVLSIKVRIAGRDYPAKVSAEEESYLREAGRLINERMRLYRERGFREDQDILTMVAIDSIVAQLKGDEYKDQLQTMVTERISRLDKLVTSVITP